MDVEVADADADGPHERRDGRQVPGVGVEGIGKERLEIGRAVPVRGVDRAHALAAIRLNLMAMQELSAELQVVMALRAVRVREVVARVPDPLVLVSRKVLVAANGEAGERDARRPRVDAVGALPVVRPRREILVLETEHRLPAFDLVHGPIADDLREQEEKLLVVLAIRAGRGRTALEAAGYDGLPDRGPGILAHQPGLRRQLIVETQAALLLIVRAAQRDVERWIRRIE